LTSNNSVANDRYTFNPVIHDGNYTKILQCGFSPSEILELADFLEKYEGQGFRIIETIHENKGLTPAEGSITVIMEYDQIHMNACYEANRKDRGH